MLRVASALLWIDGLGFGVFCLPALRNLAAGKDIPIIMGFPAYGRGPLDRIGVPSTVPLVSAFLIVCALECVAGWSLWGAHKWGAVLALVVLPAGAIFWWGFALPIPPILAVVRTMLMLMAWKSLT